MILREMVTRLGWKVDMAGASQYDAALRGMQQRAQTVSTAIGTTLGVLAANAITSIAMAIGSATAALPREVIAAGDAMTGTFNALNGALHRTGESSADIYQQMRTGALETGLAVDQTARAFQRFAPAFQDMNRPSADAVTLLINLQKGFVAANSSTAEMSSTMHQLGQSFTSMNLQLGEFNSFQEQSSPDMVRAFAAATGNTMSTIRKAIEDGKITSEMMVRGFEAAGRAGAEAFGRMTPTVKNSLAQMRVAMSLFFGELDATFGISQRVAQGLLRIKAAFEWAEDRVLALRAVIAEMGGLREAIYRAATAVASLAAAWVLFNFGAAIGMVAGLARGMWLLVAAINAVAMRFLVAAGAAGAIYVVLDDLKSWITQDGRRNWIGDQLGPIDQLFTGLADRLRTAMGDLMGALGGNDAARAGALRGFDAMKEAITGLIGLLKELKEVAIDVFTYLATRNPLAEAGAAVRAWLQASDARITGNQAPGNSLYPNAPAALGGAAQGGWLEGFFRDFGRQRVDPSQIGSGPRATAVTLNAPVTVHVTATSASDAALGQAVGQSTGSAIEVRLGDFARQLMMALPPAEAPAR